MKKIISLLMIVTALISAWCLFKAIAGLSGVYVIVLGIACLIGGVSFRIFARITDKEIEAEANRISETDGTGTPIDVEMAYKLLELADREQSLEYASAACKSLEIEPKMLSEQELSENIKKNEEKSILIAELKKKGDKDSLIKIRELYIEQLRNMALEISTYLTEDALGVRHMSESNDI